MLTIAKLLTMHITHTKDIACIIKRRKIVQRFLALVVIIVISLGWKYPLLGFIVPFIVLFGIGIAFFKGGRYLCGNLCPGGAFCDQLLELISPQRAVPSILRSMKLRWLIFILLIGFIVYRVSLNPYSMEHWGKVFWQISLMITLVGTILALFFRARTWCVFCPMGTLCRLIGGKESFCPLILDATKCDGCKICEKVCPMNLAIISDKKTLIVTNDCIRCYVCVASCPSKALAINNKKQ